MYRHSWKAILMVEGTSLAYFQACPENFEVFIVSAPGTVAVVGVRPKLGVNLPDCEKY